MGVFHRSAIRATNSDPPPPTLPLKGGGSTPECRAPQAILSQRPHPSRSGPTNSAAPFFGFCFFTLFAFAP